MVFNTGIGWAANGEESEYEDEFEYEYDWGTRRRGEGRGRSQKAEHVFMSRGIVRVCAID